MRITLHTKIWVIKGKKTGFYYTIDNGNIYVGQYYYEIITSEFDAKNRLAELNQRRTYRDNGEELEIVETTLWDLQG